PGDGGWGAIVDLQAFLRAWRFTLYLQGLYLFNPRDTNGVITNRPGPGEGVMSVADSYLAAAGAFFSIPGLPFGHSLAIKLGRRSILRDRRAGSERNRSLGIFATWTTNFSCAVSAFLGKSRTAPSLRFSAERSLRWR